MVWGVIFPASYGKHNPESVYDSAFDAQLVKNFEAMPKERQELYQSRLPSYVTSVLEMLTKDPAKHWRQVPPYGPLAENEWPAEYALKKRYDNLASIIEAGSATSHFMVDETLKVLIERLEPGVHQFRPTTLIMPRGALYPVQYYTIMFGHWIDSFVPELSDRDCFKGDGVRSSYFVKNHTKKDMVGLTLSRQRFGVCHFWREKKLLSPDICISDTLYDHIIRAGLRLPKHFQMKEV